MLCHPGDGRWLHLFSCSTTTAHQLSGNEEFYYCIEQDSCFLIQQASEVMPHYCYQLARISASFQEGSLLHSHSSEACGDADSLGRPRGRSYLQLPSDTRPKDGGFWFSSSLHTSGLCSPPSKEAEAAAAHQRVKPCLPSRDSQGAGSQQRPLLMRKQHRRAQPALQQGRCAPRLSADV